MINCIRSVTLKTIIALSATMRRKLTRNLKFFDEAGMKIPDVGTHTYGHSAKGSRCVEVGRKLESPNTTLSMLVSLSGPEYYNREL